MQRYTAPLTAALAAIVLTFATIGSLLAVPPAQLAMSSFAPALV